MSFKREVFNLPQVLLMTSAAGLLTVGMYAARHQHPDLVWFIESWGLYIGVALTIGTFLFGLSLIGKPIHSEKTNQRLEAEHNRELAEHNREVFEWNSKSPEERAIITAARENELLQLTQILQNNTIIRNQEELKRKLPK